MTHSALFDPGARGVIDVRVMACRLIGFYMELYIEIRVLFSFDIHLSREMVGLRLRATLNFSFSQALTKWLSFLFSTNRSLGEQSEPIERIWAL